MKRLSERIPFMLLISALLFLSVPAFGLFHPLFAGGPYRGRVIDAETKQPLDGSSSPGDLGEQNARGCRLWVFISGLRGGINRREWKIRSRAHPPMSLIPAWVDGPRIDYLLSGLWILSPIYHLSPPFPSAASTRNSLR